MLLMEDVHRVRTQPGMALILNVQQSSLLRSRLWKSSGSVGKQREGAGQSTGKKKSRHTIALPPGGKLRSSWQLPMKLATKGWQRHGRSEHGWRLTSEDRPRRGEGLTLDMVILFHSGHRIG